MSKENGTKTPPLPPKTPLIATNKPSAGTAQNSPVVSGTTPEHDSAALSEPVEIPKLPSAPEQSTVAASASEALMSGVLQDILDELRPSEPKVKLAATEEQAPPVPASGGTGHGGGSRGGDGGTGGGGDGGKPRRSLRELVDSLVDTVTVIRSCVDFQNSAKDQNVLNLQESLRKIDAAIFQLGGQLIGVGEGLRKDIRQTLQAELGQGTAALKETEKTLEQLRGSVVSLQAELAHVFPEAQRDRAEVRDALQRASETLIGINRTAAETRSQVTQLQDASVRADEKALQSRNELTRELGGTKDALKGLSQAVIEKLPLSLSAEVTQRLKERLEQTEREFLAPLRASHAEVAGRLRADVGPKVTETATSIAKLAGDEQTRYARLRRAQRELQQTLGSDIGNRLDDAASALGALKERADRAAGALALVEQKQDKTQESLDGLSKTIPSNLTEQLATLSQSVSGLGTATASQARLDGVERRVESIEKSVGSALSRELGAVQHGVDGLQTELFAVSDGLKTAQVALRSELERTEKRLADAIRDAATVAHAQQAEASAEAQALSLGELKEPVGAVHRSVGDGLSARLHHLHQDLLALRTDTRAAFDGLERGAVGVRGTLDQRVAPALIQVRTTLDGIGVRLEKRGDQLEATVAGLSQTVRDDVRERTFALAQTLTQQGSQRAQECTALVQQVTQLQKDAVSALASIGASVGTGMSQRVDGQAAAVAELQRGTTQRLGELATNLATVRKGTDTLREDVSQSRSTLVGLTTAVNSQHAAVLGELVAIRTLTQDGLATTLRSSVHELSSRLQGIDGKLETSSDAIQRDLHELGRSAASQHSQLIENVAAIRDLVRADGTGHGRTADLLTRNLEETRLSVEKLTGAVSGQHGAVLGSLSGVQAAVTTGFQKDLEAKLHPLLRLHREDLEKNVQQMLTTHRAQIEDEFANQLSQTLLELKKQTEFVHGYLAREEKILERQTTAEKIKNILAPDFKDINDKFNEIEFIAKGTKDQIEGRVGPIDNIQRDAAQSRKDVQEIKGKTDHILIKLGERAVVQIPATFKVIIFGGMLLFVVALFLIILKLHGIDVVSLNSTDQARLQSILDEQKTLKQEWAGNVSVLTLLAKEGTTRLASVEDKLCSLGQSVAKLPAAHRSCAVSPPPPQVPAVAVQLTNTNSASCGAGGQSGGPVTLTCLGKTTTTAPAVPAPKASTPQTASPSPKSN